MWLTGSPGGGGCGDAEQARAVQREDVRRDGREGRAASPGRERGPRRGVESGAVLRPGRRGARREVPGRGGGRRQPGRAGGFDGPHAQEGREEVKPPITRTEPAKS